jgi:hypothetical protein
MQELISSKEIYIDSGYKYLGAKGLSTLSRKK